MSQRFIGYGRQTISEQDIATVNDVLRGDYLTQGPVVEQFEAALAKRVGARYGVVVSSGTAALHLAALVADMGPGDVGVTPTLTFVASANAFLYTGAKACVVDIDSDTLNLSPDALEAALKANPSIKAVTSVHFGGLESRTEKLRKIIGPNRFLIEDACHSLGGMYENGKPIGCCQYADMTVFSFHPVKPITTGEGGAITTNDKALYERLLRLRNHGIERRPECFENIDAARNEDGEPKPWFYEQQDLGFNYRMTDIQAALGLSQLENLGTFIARRREIAARYDEAFASVTGLGLTQSSAAMRARSGHHLYVLHFDFKAIGKSRETVMKALRAERIGTQVHYIPVHRQPYYQNAYGWQNKNFPNAEFHYSRALSIPLFPGLTDDEVSHVIESIIGVCGG